jgi:hypothetical protein
MQELNNLAGITVNPVKTSIQIKASATFLSIKVKKTHLELEFQLSEEIDPPYL